MKQILRYIAISGVFVIPFIPLVVTNSFFFPFITGKNFTFRILVEIVFGAWAVLALMDHSYRPKKSWILYLFAIFVGLILLSDMSGMYWRKSIWSNYERMEGWITLIHLLGYFVVAGSVFSTEKLWRTFFRVSFGVNAAVLSYSILQIGGYLTINQGGMRVDGTFGNTIYLAVYAMFHIFLALIFFIKNKKEEFTGTDIWTSLVAYNAGFIVFLAPLFSSGLKDKEMMGSFAFLAFTLWIVFNAVLFVAGYIKDERVSLSLITVLNLFVIYHSATRGVMLGLIIGLLVSAILIAIFEKQNKKLRIVSASVIGAVIVVVGLFVTFKNSDFVMKSPVLSRLATISLTEKTTLSRLILWNMAIEGFKEKPVLGWGQENFNYVFNKYFDPKLYNQEQWFDRTHNVIFDWLVVGGALGLLSYLSVLVGIIWILWRKKNIHISIAEKSLITGLLLGYFIQNLTAFDNVTSYIMYISVAAYVYSKTSGEERIGSGWKLVNNRALVPVAGVVLLVIIYSVNVPAMRANTSLLTALNTKSDTDVTAMVNLFKKALNEQSFGDSETREQIVAVADRAAQAQVTISGKDELIALAKSEGEKQLALTPSDARYQVVHGLFLAHTGDLDTAIKHIDIAHKLSPKKQTISATLASLYVVKKDFEKALPVFKETFELDKGFLEVQMMYASAAIYSGDLKLADTVLAGLPTSTVAGSNNILQAYFDTKQYKRLAEMIKIRVDADPTNVNNQATLAQVYVYMGDKAKAVAQIKAAISAVPGFKDEGEKIIANIWAGRPLVNQ